jgi:hypothetical protein
MSYWIEVSSEYRFKQKIDNILGLNAPATKRYFNLLKDIKNGDIILHYITATGTNSKNYKSSVIGISTALSSMVINESRIIVELSNVERLPMAIFGKDIKLLERKSDFLERLLSMNFQRYLTEIRLEDLFYILKIHSENYNFLINSKKYYNIFE